jgi:hypothetical protein
MSTTPYFLRNPAYDDQAQQPVTMAPAVEPQGMAAPVIQHPLHAMVAPIVGVPKLSAMAAPVDAGPEPAAMSPADAATMAPAPSAALPSTKQPTVRTMSPIERREDVLQQGMAKKPEGFMGKLGHGLGMAGRIAGDIFAPAETELVVQGLGKEGIGPRANEFRNKEMQELEAEKSKEGLEGAQASKAQADVPFVESETAKNEAGLPYVAPTAEADIAEKNAQAENLKNPRPKNDFELWFQHNPTGTAEQYQQLLSKPLSPDDAASRNAVWDRIAEQYHLPKGQFRAGMPTADAAALAASLNNVIARGQGAQSISIRMADEGAKGATSLMVPVDPNDPTKGYTLQRVLPGQTVGAGALTPGGMGAKEKPTADEQRRADLAENLNENLNTLEDIAKRRPELFGPVQGRLAELRQHFGSNDPDLAALLTAEHQIGMAQISAHGMRSAQGVQAAADSIMNSLHNGPKALMGSINTVRNSVKTFTADANRNRAGNGQQGGATPKVGDVKTFPNGKQGRWDGKGYVAQ